MIMTTETSLPLVQLLVRPHLLQTAAGKGMLLKLMHSIPHTNSTHHLVSPNLCLDTAESTLASVLRAPPVKDVHTW